MRFYHVTGTERVPDILFEGLKASNPYTRWTGDKGCQFEYGTCAVCGNARRAGYHEPGSVVPCECGDDWVSAHDDPEYGTGVYLIEDHDNAVIALDCMSGIVAHRTDRGDAMVVEIDLDVEQVKQLRRDPVSPRYGDTRWFFPGDIPAGLIKLAAKYDRRALHDNNPYKPTQKLRIAA